MALRVLVCVEDAGIAHVIAARLQRDGVDGVVVDPRTLVEEARRGAAAVAVQHRYPTGEIGSSLLRQLRVARGEVVPAVVVAGSLSGPDRLVYERQYKVTTFLPVGANPVEVAAAAASLAGVASDADELELHEDERKNDFDISVESQIVERVPSNAALDLRANALEDAFGDVFDDDDDHDVKTAKTSATQLQRARAAIAPTKEHGRPVDVPRDLSRLPPPGGDQDIDLGEAAPARVKPPVGAPTVGKGPSPFELPQTVSDNSPPAAPPRPSSEGEAMQIQELQRTQAELKKALLTERKARETAQKRVEELESKLTKMGDAPIAASQGVPADGVFEDLRYPALLARFRAEAFTGSLVMLAAGTTRTVFLKDGLPVAFTSSEPGQRIGKVLVAQGRITDEQYMKAATRMVEKSIKLTTALVELGLIDAESLDVEQRNLTRDQIIAGFELVQGRFTTSQGATPDANTPTFDFGPGEIYIQGYRRYAPKSEMIAAYETLRDKYLVANGRLASYRPKLGLLGDDERFLRLLGEALTVEEVVERAGVTPESVARLLSALQALDLVEEWSPGVEQFRSRLRAERQRHAEELASLSAQHRQIEERLLKAFEQALAGHRDGGGLAATLSTARSDATDAAAEKNPRALIREASASLPPSSSSTSLPAAASSMPPATASLPWSSSLPPSSSSLAPKESGREYRPTDARAASLSSSSSSSSLVSAALGTGLGAARAAVRSEKIQDEGRLGWDGSPSSRPGDEKASSSAQAISTLQLATPSASSPVSTPSSSPTSGDASPFSTSYSMGSASSLSTPPQASSNAASSPPPSREPETSPADRKYREGIEQASQERLDEAEVTLREAVRLDATRPEYLTALARVLLANPRYERAGTLPVVRSLLDRAVTLSPGHAEASALHKEVIAEMGG
jgi:hypothetical protein